MSPVLLEVALESADDAVCARRAGADRFELCAALDQGGLTPTSGTLQAVRANTDVPIFVMIRPRAGGFSYRAAEIDVMCADIDILLRSGADGVVFGALAADFRVEAAACRTLLAAARGRPAVFHRAFDLTPDPIAALEALIELGFRRVLTSGQCEQACDPRAVDLIGKLNAQAGQRIEILPGSALRAENVRSLIERAGCRQVHGAFRTACADPGLGQRGVRFGFGHAGAGDQLFRTDEGQVRAMRAALDGTSPA